MSEINRFEQAVFFAVFKLFQPLIVQGLELLEFFPESFDNLINFAHFSLQLL